MRTLLMLLAASGIFYSALDTTFQDMTRHDCEVHHVQLACDSVR